MDKRSWPWKRKDKTSKTDAPDFSNKGDQGKTKNVQISAESYIRLQEYEAEVKILNDKLSSTQSEITTKDTLVKQHARVAEEAIAGWEKAEAESATLKSQLESVTLLKLSAEDRVAHLDDAIKASVQQMHIVKEESEQMLHDTIFAKTTEWEAIRSELEDRISDFEQELMRSNAENAALSRALQERSAMLVRINDEKSRAEAEIEVLKSGIQSCEKEMNSLKYEVHVVTKELEIRNEEKNMSLRLAETANKQHVEDVKKIGKLEAECQRLRGLVKKKLPGPAALAQMKLEVESLSRDNGETRLRRSPAKSSSSYFALEDMRQYQKENEYLTARLLAAEEETNMLKETLSKRNSELQATRSFCVKTASKLRSAEAQVIGLNQSSMSYVSISEDGADEVASLAESCSASLISEFSQAKESSIEKKSNSKQIELMDDFLEMEKLACASTESKSPKGKDTLKDEISEDGNNSCSNKNAIDEATKNHISQILEIIVPLCKEAVEVHGRSCDDRVLSERIAEFSTLIDKVLSNEESLDKFVFALSHVLSETRDVRSNMLADKGSEGEGNTHDCIDKLTLLEKRIAQNEPLDPANSNGVNSPGYEPHNTYEQMKLEKGRMEMALARSTETSERARVQVAEMEQQLAELKSQLAARQKSNSLAETQLKCMAESYESLESRARELETELNMMRAKAEGLECELQEEKERHQSDLAKYNDLKEQLERDMHANADLEKQKQEREIAAAAEKLAECQETILLLGRQLKAMQPPVDSTSSSADKQQTNSSPSAYSLQSILNSEQQDQNSADNDDARSVIHIPGDGGSPVHRYNPHVTASEFETLPPKSKRDRSRSTSSSSLSSMLNEKQSRGLSRFFSRGKGDY